MGFKNIEKEILKIIYAYSANERIIDDEAISRLIEVVVNERKLNSYLKLVTVTEALEKSDHMITCASYNLIYKTMEIDYDGITRVLQNNEQYSDSLNNIEFLMLQNITIIQIILHELEHVYQNKLSEQYDINTIESKLINVCFQLENAIKNPDILDAMLNRLNTNLFFLMDYYRKIYKDTYIYNPSERLAELNSYFLVKDSIKQLKNQFPRLYLFIQTNLIKRALMGYQEAWADQSSCPTEKFLKYINQEQLWQSFPFYDSKPKKLYKNVAQEYSLVRKLTLGLPIYNEEFEALEERIV